MLSSDPFGEYGIDDLAGLATPSSRAAVARGAAGADADDPQAGAGASGSHRGSTASALGWFALDADQSP